MKPKSSHKPTRKKPTRSAHLAPSMLHQMEAMVRHPAFRRSAALWRSIFAKNYVGLTEDEERERNAPRTHFQKAAIMEADARWLSRSIQDIRQRGEAVWTTDAVNSLWGDPTHTVQLLIPTDLSLEAIKGHIEQRIREERKKSNITPIQNLRAPEKLYPWDVYDAMQKKNATLAIVRDKLCGSYGRIDRRFARRRVRLSAEDKRNVKRDLKRISNAYRFAQAMIARLDSPLK